MATRSYSRRGNTTIQEAGETSVAGRPVHTFEVIRSEQLTPHMTRVVLGGGGFDTFAPSESTDAYVKLVIVRPDVDSAAVDALAPPPTPHHFRHFPASTQ